MIFYLVTLTQHLKIIRHALHFHVKQVRIWYFSFVLWFVLALNTQIPWSVLLYFVVIGSSTELLKIVDSRFQKKKKQNIKGTKLTTWHIMKLPCALPNPTTN